MLIERLASLSGVTESKLRYLAKTASSRYRIYDIPKRSGGHRQIAHPSRALKAVQRWISRTLISEFPVHDCATAYKKGASIRLNALMHAQTNFTLRMDFVDFFPSFSFENILDFVGEKNSVMNIGLSEIDIEFIAAILTRNGAVTIGAPSSPAITNAIMYEFDKHVCGIANEGGFIYSRYADDMFVSTGSPNSLRLISQQIAEASARMPYANLIINHDKTRYLSRRYRRSITGLVITPNGHVSIGRQRKREIKSMVHLYTLNKLEREKIQRLRGLVAFVKGVDLAFHDALRRKYGDDAIERILQRE